MLLITAACGIPGTHGFVCDTGDDTANYGNGIGDFWSEDQGNAGDARGYCYDCNHEDNSDGCRCTPADTSGLDRHPVYSDLNWGDHALMYGNKGSIKWGDLGMSTATYNKYGCRKGFHGRYCLSCGWAKCSWEGTFIENEAWRKVGQVPYGGYGQYMAMSWQCDVSETSMFCAI